MTPPTPATVEAPAALHATWLGRIAYRPALDLQRRSHARRVAGEIPDTLLLLEHEHVITLGRRASADDVLTPPGLLAKLGVEVVETDRGGQATYHGPGQLVGYPIVDLKAAGLGPVSYVRILEDTLIATVGACGVDAFRVDGQTGVWTRGGKIAAIGVRIGANVTTHGFALNVATDLACFRHIVPCGAPASPAASVLSETGRAPGLVEVAAEWARRFAAGLGRDPVRVSGGQQTAG